MEGLKIALHSLATHKLRTILAMLGVFLGALVLTLVAHLSVSLTRQADLETQKFGPNLVQVAAGRVRFNRGEVSVSRVATTFTLDDAKNLQEIIPQIKLSSPYASSTRRVRFANTQTTGQIFGVTENYFEVRALELSAGRFINNADEANLSAVCIIGADIAERLFMNFKDNADIIGQKIYIANMHTEIIGIMPRKGQDLGGSNLDDQILLPLQTFLRRLHNRDYITGVYLNLYNPEDADNVENAISTIMRQRHNITHGERDDFSIMVAKDANNMRDEALALIGSLGILSACMSFAVGGLGILSIMILLVKARQLEIGVRRAVGASKKAIVRQFLTEAGIMSGVGGITGVVLGLVLLALIYKLSGLPFIYDPFLCLGASLGSVTIGIIAGAWPAWQASRVEVLVVLKSW